MKIKELSSPLWLPLAASRLLVALPFLRKCSKRTGKASPATFIPTRTGPRPLASSCHPEVDRSQAYFHSALAHIYEEQAIASGRPEYMRHAVEEYKTALSADPVRRN